MTITTPLIYPSMSCAWLTNWRSRKCKGAKSRSFTTRKFLCSSTWGKLKYPSQRVRAHSVLVVNSTLHKVKTNQLTLKAKNQLPERKVLRLQTFEFPTERLALSLVVSKIRLQTLYKVLMWPEQNFVALGWTAHHRKSQKLKFGENSSELAQSGMVRSG